MAIFIGCVFTFVAFSVLIGPETKPTAVVPMTDEDARAVEAELEKVNINHEEVYKGEEIHVDTSRVN